jgi:hypothetical protein
MRQDLDPGTVWGALGSEPLTLFILTLIFVCSSSCSLPGWLPFCGVLPDLGRSKRG